MSAAVLLIGAGVAWRQLQPGDWRPVPWQDVTARVGPVLWPQAANVSFSTRRQLVHYLALTFPEGGAPAPPPVDFRRHRLVLVAAGPRSSTGYEVRIVAVRERSTSIRVLVRETTPSLRARVVPRLTSPYRLIEIPAGTKRVYVSWQGRP